MRYPFPLSLPSPDSSLIKSLPVNRITVNATFKHSKEVLKKRSWDPDTPPNLEEGEEEKDSCYWLNGETGKYEKLDGGCWTRIKGGVAKL